jgi:hypothetical protein
MKLNREETGFCLPKRSFPPQELFGSMEFVEGDKQYRKPPNGQGKPHPNKMGNWFDIVNHVNFMIVNGNWPI